MADGQLPMNDRAPFDARPEIGQVRMAVTGVNSIRRRRIVAAVVIALVGGLAATTMSSAVSTPTGSARAYVSLVPARLFDSRADGVTADGSFAAVGVLTAGSTTELPVAGRGGVADDAVAAVLNVTATEAGGAGFVTVFPCGTIRPLASTLNVIANSTVANAAVSKIGVGGKICLYTSDDTQLVVDVNGYFPHAARFTSLVPARVFDSRPDGSTIDGSGAGSGRRASGSTSEIAVATRGAVAANASAVMLNVTVVDAVGPGFVTVFPCGGPQPMASNLNFVAGTAIANAVVAKIGVGGKVCIFVSNATQLVVDVNGYFPPTASYTSLQPARLADSRLDDMTVDARSMGMGIRSGGSTTAVQVAGRGGVARDASAAVLNVTVTDAAGPGFVTVYPCGSQQPLASNLNFVAKTAVANAVIAKIGGAGQVCIYVSAATHVVVDVNGFFESNFGGTGGPDDSADIPTMDLPAG